jgi:hypothetical protein
LAGATFFCDGRADATAAVGAATGKRAGIHLSWVRDEATSACPDAGTVEKQVARRLDDDPFTRTPEQFIEALVTRDAGAFHVNITMRGADGTSLGSRTISSAAPDCRSIADAAALTIAILVDPDALLRPAPVEVPPIVVHAAPPPPPLVAAPASDLSGRVALLAMGEKGFLPDAAPGIGLSASVDLVRRASAGLAVGVFPEHRSTSVQGDFAFGLSFLDLDGCFVTPQPWLRWELCGGGSVGVLHVVVYDPQPVNPGQRWFFALSELTRVVVPVFQAWTIEVGVEALEPFVRRAFFVEGRPAGMDTVFTQPRVAWAGWMGVGLRWR